MATIVFPPSYGMNPWAHQPDLFRGPATPEEGWLHAAIPNAPMQEGDWAMEPEYEGAFRFLYNPHTQVILSRSLTTMTLPLDSGICFNALRQRITEDCWLQCIGIPHPDPSPDSIAVGVEDIMDFEKPYIARRRLLESRLEELGIKLPPQNRYGFLVPRFSESIKLNLWFALQEINHTKGKLIYSGILSKKSDSKFEKQLDDFKLTSPWWHRHGFSQ